MSATWQIHTGDVLDVLRTMPTESVQCVVTSPPYWGLRDYGVEGAIGLEPTVGEHMARMVEVFREVRRVLRRDGTAWVNYGDAYAHGGPGGSIATSTLGGGQPRGRESLRSAQVKRKDAAETAANVARAAERGYTVGAWGASDRAAEGFDRCHGDSGLAAKQRLMLPARLALALQEPYYTGRIRDERDRVWLAAMIDGEGCIYIHKRKEGQSNGQGRARKNASYGAGLEVANTSAPIVDKCLNVTGLGSVCHQDNGRKQRLYRWTLRSNQCRDVLREVYPYLVAKKQQARLALSCPPSGPDAALAHEGLKALHGGGVSGIDFGEPASMYGPGWWVRSEIVWSKLNPMPSSVTDRPTDAHEMLYLLSPSPRYFYDADAVREPAVHAGDVKRLGPKSLSRGQATGAGREASGNGLAETVTVADGRNLRTVWQIPTQPYHGAHFASYPERLVTPCVRAGTSERGACSECGAPWRRVVEASGGAIGAAWHDHSKDAEEGNFKTAPSKGYKREHKGWEPTCEHADAPTRPCVVLDPFCGSGTTGVVALREGCSFVGIEMNPEYVRLARERIGGGAPSLFAAEASA